jgi:hypothetical protein
MGLAMAVKIADLSYTFAREPEPQPVCGIEAMATVNDEHKPIDSIQSGKVLHVMRDIDGHVIVVDGRPDAEELVAPRVGRTPISQVPQINVIPGSF